MQKSEKRTKIILWAVVALAVVGCALWLVLPHGGTTDCTAEIWIDGQMVRGIYLPQAADEVISLAEYGKEVQLEVKTTASPLSAAIAPIRSASTMAGCPGKGSRPSACPIVSASPLPMAAPSRWS